MALRTLIGSLTVGHCVDDLVEDISPKIIILCIEGCTKMIKTLIKIFMPSPRKLANMAAEKI